MVSGYSNIIPYGSEYGPLVAVCGSENFMLICRERKNYVLTGELTTGNVNITECDQAVAGAANARAVSNAFSNKIVFMNNTGVYSVTSSGQITEISEEIRDLFTGRPMDGNPFNPNVFRNTVQKLEAAFDGGIFKIALDEIRGFIYFFTGKIDNAFSLTLEQSNVLVFDTNDGSWYEFDGNGSWTFEALAGKITNLGAKIYTEDGTIRKSDPFSAGDAKQVLLTTSMTMGEPSLEKQATQVKIYGKVEQQLLDEDGNVVRPEIKIGHLTEWKRFEGTPTSEYGTYVSYPRANDVDFDPEQYTHKQKLNSTKAQAVSILIESVDGDAITIEGMEIEIGGVQDGMKR